MGGPVRHVHFTIQFEVFTVASALEAQLSHQCEDVKDTFRVFASIRSSLKLQLLWKGPQ
jgi:hypothetical protein